MTRRSNNAAADETATTIAEAPAPTEVERPTEEGAARALRDAVFAFNKNALTRSVLTDADREAIAEIETLCAAYSSAAVAAWAGNVASWSRELKWGPVTTPAAVTQLETLIADYLLECIDTEIYQRESGRTKTRPCILGELNRADLASDGGVILQQIEAVIAEGYARIAGAREAERNYAANVAWWLTQPLVRQIIESLVAIFDADPTLITSRIGVLDALSWESDVIILAAERSGDAPHVKLFRLGFRQWLPVAKRLLTETEKGAAA
jgi:hypothetical protein